MRTEQQALRVSFVAILAFCALGITFGLVSGSGAIIFDGVVSLVDAAMSVVSIVVAGLIARSTADGLSTATTRRFTMGFWHFEPMVLAVNALLLLSVAAYAVVQSVATILAGGRDVAFGPALVYAVLVLVLTTTVGLLEHRANRRIRSALVAMDVKGWLVSGAVTGALLVAFAVALLLEGTSGEWLRPYVDPAVLMVVALALLPVPIPTLRRAVAEIALVTPPELREEADRAAAGVTWTGHRCLFGERRLEPDTPARRLPRAGRLPRARRGVLPARAGGSEHGAAPRPGPPRGSVPREAVPGEAAPGRSPGRPPRPDRPAALCVPHRGAVIARSSSRGQSGRTCSGYGRTGGFPLAGRAEVSLGRSWPVGAPTPSGVERMFEPCSGGRRSRRGWRRCRRAPS